MQLDWWQYFLAGLSIIGSPIALKLFETWAQARKESYAARLASSTALSEADAKLRDALHSRQDKFEAAVMTAWETALEQNAKLDLRLTTMSALLETEREQNAATQRELGQLKERSEIQATEINELRAALHAEQIKNSDLNMTIGRMSEQQAALVQRLQVTTSKYEFTQRDLDKARSELAETKAQLADTQEQLRQANERMNRLRGDITLLQNGNGIQHNEETDHELHQSREGTDP